MPGFTFRKVALLAAVLLVTSTAFQVFVRLSPAYTSAVKAYRSQMSGTELAQVGYCYLCSSRVSYGNGSWSYRFTLVVKSHGASQRVRVLTQPQVGSDLHAVTFE